MKKILFVSPLLITLLAIIYTLNCEPMTEGVAFGLGILIIVATMEAIGYGIVLIWWLNEQLEKKFNKSLQSSE